MGFPCLNKWKIMTNYTNFLLHTPRSAFTACWFDATTLLNPQQTLITNTPKFLQKICYNTWKQQNSYVVGSNSKGHNKVQHQSIINQMHQKMKILWYNTRVQVHQNLKLHTLECKNAFHNIKSMITNFIHNDDIKRDEIFIPQDCWITDWLKQAWRQQQDLY
jgi:hypothetical protein